MGKLPIKISDIVIILLAIALTAVSAFSVYVKPANTVQVLIEGPTQKWVFPLDAEETVSVKGIMGDTVIRISNNEAWVDSSPCDNQTCVGMGHVDYKGAWVACLPNNVYFIIEGSDDPENNIDAAAW